MPHTKRFPCSFRNSSPDEKSVKGKKNFSPRDKRKNRDSSSPNVPITRRETSKSREDNEKKETNIKHSATHSSHSGGKKRTKSKNSSESSSDSSDDDGGKYKGVKRKADLKSRASPAVLSSKSNQKHKSRKRSESPMMKRLAAYLVMAKKSFIQGFIYKILMCMGQAHLISDRKSMTVFKCRYSWIC